MPSMISGACYRILPTNLQGLFESIEQVFTQVQIKRPARGGPLIDRRHPSTTVALLRWRRTFARLGLLLVRGLVGVVRALGLARPDGRVQRLQRLGATADLLRRLR